MIISDGGTLVIFGDFVFISEWKNLTGPLYYFYFLVSPAKLQADKKNGNHSDRYGINRNYLGVNLSINIISLLSCQNNSEKGEYKKSGGICTVTLFPLWTRSTHSEFVKLFDIFPFPHHIDTFIFPEKCKIFYRVSLMELAFFLLEYNTNIPNSGIFIKNQITITA